MASPTPYSRYRLPRGRHVLSREEVVANQRWRLIGAAADILVERGLTRVTARLIAQRASVSNSTFYEHFQSVDDILAVCSGVAAKSTGDVVATACANGNGERKVNVAMAAALALGTSERALMSTMGPAVAAALPSVAAQREALVRRIGSLLSDSRCQGAHKRPRAVDQLLIGATLAISADRLGPNESADPPVLGEELSALLR